ncbi:MAG TPA: hypothetical protein VII13_12255 [Vicinamibacteria bacterium]|jgi:hypothetical protein
MRAHATTARWARCLALVGAMLPVACYQSDFPLDPEPTADLEVGLLGTWRCLPLDADGDEPPATLILARGRPRAYAVSWLEEGGATARYEAFGSSLDGVTVWNVQEQKDTGDGRWVFARHTLPRPSVLHLQLVPERALEDVPRTRAALRDAVGRLRTSDSLLQDFCVCARVKGAS